MFFNKKNKKTKKCESCGSKTGEKYSFCPHCGNNFNDSLKEKKDYGFLGKNDAEIEQDTFQQNFGFTDKLIGSIMNSMMKNLDKQFKNQFRDIEKDFENAEIRSFPNGIRIKIAGPLGLQQKTKKINTKIKHEITQNQIKKMSSLPRTTAKANVKRLGNKIIYELLTSGVSSSEDVFVSKLESGYEVKAIGNKKVYVNKIPINLPLSRCSVLNDRLLVEFHSLNE